MTQVIPGIDLENSDLTLLTFLIFLGYMFYVERWFSKLAAQIKPHLYVNGGPIIMVQVENEYGSYPACDRDYTTRLRDFIRNQLGKNVLLFTTDGDGDGYLQCGRVPGVYATVDFGSGNFF
jgi:beta-galactosidase